MKQKKILTVLFLLGTTLAVHAQWADFWSVSSSGDTLYYQITDESRTSSGSGYTYVAVVSPNSPSYVTDSASGYQYTYGWAGHQRPTGAISIPETVYYNGTACTVRSIGQSAFAGCDEITSVTIPRKVQRIDGSAFAYCTQLFSISIPTTVTTIAGAALSGIPNVIYSGVATGSPWGACAQNGYVDGDYVYTDSRRTTLSAVRRSLTQVSIPNSVTTIGSKAFFRCMAISEVTLPTNLTSIGSEAFRGCTALTQIAIPQNVSTIGSSAFDGCRALQEVSFGNGLRRLGGGAFSSCTALERLEFPAGLRSIGSHAVYNCSNLRYLSIPYTVDTIVNQLADLCVSLDTLVFDIDLPSNFTSTLSPSIFYFLNLPDTAHLSLTLILGPHVTNIPTEELYNQTTHLYEERWFFHYLDDYLQHVVVQAASRPSCANPYAGDDVTLHIPCNVDYSQSEWQCYNDIQSFQPYTAEVQEHYRSPEEYTMGMVEYSLHCDTLSLQVLEFGGYRFSQWSDGDTSLSRTISLDKDTIIKARFVPRNFNVTIQSEDSSMGEVVVMGNSNFLDTITLHAVAAPHYHFCRWDDGDTSNPRSMVVEGDIQLTAIFAEDSHMVVVRSAHPTFGTVSGGGRFPYNSLATISATANNGYEFSSWDDLSTTNPRQINVTQDTVITAYFIKVRVDTLYIYTTLRLCTTPLS